MGARVARLSLWRHRPPRGGEAGPGKIGPTFPKRYVTRPAQAYVYLGLGQKDVRSDWLEKACEEHDGYMWTLNVDAWNVPLRSEPRFQALIKKVGLIKPVKE